MGIFSDGTAVKQVGTETFKLAKIVVDDFCIVSADEICAATRDIFEDYSHNSRTRRSHGACRTKKVRLS